MAMLRKQFEKISNDKLKILILANLDLIDERVTFKGTIEETAKIRRKIEQENDKYQLQTILLGAMKVVMHWEAHQDPSGRLKPVEKNIVMDLLKNATVPQVTDQANPKSVKGRV